MKLAAPLALVVFLSPATLLVAQDRVATRPVVNIFSLPTTPSKSQESEASQPAALPETTKKPIDPFAEPAQPATKPILQEASQPPIDPFSDLQLQEKPAEALPNPPADSSPVTEDISETFGLTTEPKLSDMPLTVDPFAQQEDNLPLEELPEPNLPIDLPKVESGTVQSGTPGISWINLNAPPVNNDHSAGYGRQYKPGIKTASLRRPSKPTPTISVAQPAMVHVPVQIKVIPTYFDYGYYYPRPAYHYPQPAPKPAYDSSEYYGNPKKRAADAQSKAFYPHTDQPLKTNIDPNLVGFDTRSVNHIGYPLNYFSYPSSNHYGVHIQSFPTSRRFDR